MNTAAQPFGGSALPLYRSHKLVRAAKIIAVHPDAQGEQFGLEFDDNQAVVVQRAWIKNRCDGNPPLGGYFVVYEDGYTSWSPAKAFEEGYRLMSPGDVAQEAQGRVAGQYPSGKANVHDEGAVVLAASLEDAPTGAMVRIDFGNPVSWVGMPPQQAVHLASTLLKLARQAGAVLTLEL